MSAPARIACFRTDRIGDLILAMPAMAALARTTPSGRIVPVVAPRTAELVAGQPWAEGPIRWTPRDGVAALVRSLVSAKVDAAVFFFPRPAAALAAALARIPLRVGPASRWYAPLFTRRVAMHRSANVKHELLYNFDLLGGFGVETPRHPELVPPVIAPEARTQAAGMLHAAGVGARYAVLHPGSGGSALNAGAAYYGTVARELAAGGRPVVLTGVNAERGLLGTVAATAGLPAARILLPPSLGVLAATLAGADAVVGPSTGPLHLAAAVGARTVALFPPLNAQQPVRWRPFGGKGTVLTPHAALCPSCLGAACPLYNCVERIPPSAAAGAAA